MNLLKTLWPTPFKIKKGSLGSFLVQLIIFIVLCAVLGWLIGFLSGVPIVGILFTIIGSLMGIYSVVGIVLCILAFFGVV